MELHPLLFALIAYVIAIIIAFCVAVIIKLIALIVRRGRKSVPAASAKKES